MQIPKIIFTLASLLTVATSLTAEVEPLRWKVTVTPSANVEAGDVFTVTAKGTVAEGWHVYGTQIGEGGPQPTTVTADGMGTAEPVGSHTVSGDLHSAFDETFQMKLSWYQSDITVTQKFRKQKEGKVALKIRYMACNDESCTPPSTHTLKVDAPAAKTKPVAKADTPETSAPSDTHIRNTADNPMPENDSSDICFVENTDGTWTQHTLPKTYAPDKSIVGHANLTSNTDNAGELILIFLAGLVAGILSVLTPCVWPVIPMTVSFFMKRNGGKRDAILYGISIAVIYIVAGMVLTVMFGADALNGLATNAIVNIMLTILMIAFALSFIGLFEIELPASWSNALNSKAERLGGVASIALMAAVLVIVSFSCTGPIVGTLLVQAAEGNSIIAPLIGMTGFAIAVGLPFAFFAAFPSLLKSLPKSGSWMQTIKYLLAAVELLFALKFFSVADMTMGWNILSRQTMIILWTLIPLLLCLMIIRKRLPIHPKTSKPQSKWSVGVDVVVIILSLAFSLYMLSGLFGSKLKNISAFLPPQTEKTVANGGLIYDDYDDALDAAYRYGRPVFVDVTGWGCVNCRKMEGKVFTDAGVMRLMSQFVILHLYVDERTPLQHRLKVRQNDGWILLQTVGEKWSWFQRRRWSANTQPQYLVIDADGQSLVEPRSYDENINAFRSWLDKALVNYRRKTDK